jgi:hypothetical protein
MKKRPGRPLSGQHGALGSSLSSDKVGDTHMAIGGPRTRPCSKLQSASPEGYFKNFPNPPLIKRGMGDSFCSKSGIAFPWLEPAAASSLQSSPGLLNNSREGGRICDSQIRKNLSVQCNLRLFQSFHKAVVRKSVRPGACANPSDPQPSKIPFSSSAISIRVDERSLNRFLCLSERPAAAADISFCSFEDLLTSSPASR